MIHLDWSQIPSCINSHGVPTLLCIPGLITNLIYWLLIFAGIVALFLIIFSGFKFINSGGDSKAVDAAKKTFTYALLGLILIFGSFAIVNLAGKVFGIQNILQFNFGPQNLNGGPTIKTTTTSTSKNPSTPKPNPGKNFNIKCNTNQQQSCNALGCKCVAITCRCDVPGGSAGSSNHFTCTDGTSRYCGSNQICLNTSEKPDWPCLTTQ